MPAGSASSKGINGRFLDPWAASGLIGPMNSRAFITGIAGLELSPAEREFIRPARLEFAPAGPAQPEVVATDDPGKGANPETNSPSTSAKPNHAQLWPVQPGPAQPGSARPSPKSSRPITQAKGQTPRPTHQHPQRSPAQHLDRPPLGSNSRRPSRLGPEVIAANEGLSGERCNWRCE